MGTTNEYKSTNIGGGLIGKECDRCKKKITEYDVCENNNWDIQFDTSNDVKLEDNKIKGYGYNLTIWLRNAYHEDCDDAEEWKETENFIRKWKELGEKIKNSHPLDNYNKTLNKKENGK